MKHILITGMLLFVLQFSRGRAQVPAFTQTILFETASAELVGSASTILDSLADRLKQFTAYQLRLEGNTDNIGDSLYNQQLSEARVQAVRKYLVARGISESAFITKAMGEIRPVVDNSSESGRQKNRRVEIYVFIPDVPEESVPSIDELYEQLARSCEEFCIDTARDTILRCTSGTLISYKAGSASAPRSCSGRCVTLRVKDVLRKSDMILDRLTTTSNNKILESGGMIYTEVVDCNGMKMSLERGSALTVMIPTDKVLPDMKLFRSSRDPHDDVMNWIAEKNAELQPLFFDNTLLDCPELRGSGCNKCRFAFCRVGRVGSALQGMYNKEVRQENRSFRECQRSQRKSARADRSKTPPPARAVAMQRPEGCAELKRLMEEYNVDNYHDLVLAINKPLMDSLGVTTIEALQDTLSKIKMSNIESNYSNGQVSEDDFNYYVFKTARLGWVNVDRFKDFEGPRTDVIVALKPSKDISCSVVFADARIALPANVEVNQYVIPDVPVGQDVWIVAMKYKDGKPLLSMQRIEVTDQKVEVDFRELTLDELKAELARLDGQVIR